MAKLKGLSQTFADSYQHAPHFSALTHALYTPCCTYTTTFCTIWHTLVCMPLRPGQQVLKRPCQWACLVLSGLEGHPCCAPPSQPAQQTRGGRSQKTEKRCGRPAGQASTTVISPHTDRAGLRIMSVGFSAGKSRAITWSALLQGAEGKGAIHIPPTASGHTGMLYRSRHIASSQAK